MRLGRGCAALAAVCLFVAVVASAQGAAPGVQVEILTTFTTGAPTAVAATDTDDIVALVGTNIVSVIGPKAKQKAFKATISGGAFGIPIGIAYDKSHELYAALPGAFAPPPSGAPGILRIDPNAKQTTPVPGSEGMVAADGFGLDSSTGNMYVTDIFGNGIWRFKPGGSAQLWTSAATNPLVVDPDGVKVFHNAAYVSTGPGKILRIPINANGTAGTATVWAQVNDPGVFLDDMVLDDRTGNVYVTRLDTDELLRITPGGAITPIATNADGLLGAANMTLIHDGPRTVIYLANTGSSFGSPNTTGAGPAILKITIG